MRSYIEICISIAFFRVPQFQKLFLDCVSKQSTIDKQDNPIQLTEWKNMTWHLDDDESVSINSRGGAFGLLKLFDWQVQFYKYIPTNVE